jgi:superfamily II DNA or RNA helicase
MSYPSIKDKDFYKKLNNKFTSYIIPRKRKTFNQICFPKEFQLQIPQKFLSKYINPKSPYKGVLVFHRIGAGKTCTAVRIGEQWKKHRRIIVVTPASLKGNFRDELRSFCAKNSYITDGERKKLKKYHPASYEYKDIIRTTNKRIDKVYRIYSYNKFVDLATEGEISFHNSVLIVDEVQNMVSEKGVFYDTLYNAIQYAPNSLRVILLSATPMFDKPVEIALTMNLLKLPLELPTGKEFEKTFINIKKNSSGRYSYRAKNMDIFKERIKGYVSYFRGAPPHAFPESQIKFVRCIMNRFQYKSYLTARSSEEKKDKRAKITKTHKLFEDGDIINLPSNFFIGTRFISNVAFPNKNIGEDGFKSFKGNELSFKKLSRYSIKFYRILRKVTRCSGTVFIYSNFKTYGGIKSLVKVLEYHGYTNYSKTGEGRKRYAIWSGDESVELKNELKAVFNQQSNYNGSKLKIMLGSPSSKEGISFYNVQQVHILEPYWNYSRMLQIIGRAVRYCSHKNLEEEKRLVKVYIYLATHYHEEESIDEYIMHLALKKNKLIGEFEIALKEAAVDCALFKNANVYKDMGDKLTCEK